MTANPTCPDKMKPRLHIALPAAAIVMAACSSPTEHSGFTTISHHGWIYGDTVRFAPDAADSVPYDECDVAIVVRNNNNYEYSNLWLSLEYPGSDTIHTDTIEIVLADRFGNWLGKGIGGSYQLSDTVMHGIALDPAKEIKVSHIMRTDTLEGIEQIGIIVYEGSGMRD